MKYRLLGRTGLRVSEIGFGCGNVGGLIIRAPLEERLSAVSRALELGINYFDTAASYGNGQSETNLGEVLNTLKPDVIVATKFSIEGEGLKDIEGTVRRSLNASLKRLGRDSVDILQLHTPVFTEDNPPSRGIGLGQVMGSGGVADTLDKLRSEGLFRFFGFTGLGDTRALNQVIESRRFDLCQSYLNLLNPSATVEIPAGFSGQNFDGFAWRAAQNGMGAVAIRVLAGGALGGDVARTGYAAPNAGGALVSGGDYEADRARAGKLGFLTRKHGSLSQAAIRFVLSQPEVSVTLVGFSNPAQIEEAAACSDLGPLPGADIEQLRKLWDADFGL